MANQKILYFLVTDRKTLDRGRAVLNPRPISINGKMEFLGDLVIDVKDGIIEVVDDGSKNASAGIQTLKTRDGFIEITEKLLTKLIDIGMKMGVLEK